MVYDDCGSGQVVPAAAWTLTCWVYGLFHVKLPPWIVFTVEQTSKIAMTFSFFWMQFLDRERG
jgi:hypothetical protein